MVKWLLSLNLLTGWLPIVAVAIGILAFLYLLVRRSRGWWIFALLAAVFSLAFSWFICWAAINLWFWWPEELPFAVVIWVGVGIWGLVLGLATALTGWRRKLAPSGTPETEPVAKRGPVRSWHRRVLSIVAAALILTLCGLQINQYFGSYPTINSLVNGAPTLSVGVPRYLRAKHKDRFLASPVRDGWVAPKGMLADGEFRQVAIPGKVSHFKARDAIVYLPPAYFTKHRPLLPVVVLVTGEPGTPSNWLASANLVALLNGNAQAHRGLAPVVVIPDPNGSESNNTMCMNSKLARADDYMAKDVPNWIKSTLDVDTNPRHWAVGGFSYGGTCAFQMVTRHPNIYPNFFAISSELEPALTIDRTLTVDRAFGGNTAAFNSVVPMSLMARNKYPQVHGWLATGQDDARDARNAVLLEAAGRKSGMTLTRTIFPGGHSWTMVTEALPAAFDFLGIRLGLQ